jgi:hypothetical protein
MAPNPSITAVNTATTAASSARRAGTAAKVTRTSPDAYSLTRDIAPRAPAAKSSAMPALLVASAASTLSTTMPMVQHRWVAQQRGGDAQALSYAQREAAEPAPRGDRRPDLAQHLVHRRSGIALVRASTPRWAAGLRPPWISPAPSGAPTWRRPRGWWRKRVPWTVTHPFLHRPGGPGSREPETPPAPPQLPLRSAAAVDCAGTGPGVVVGPTWSWSWRAAGGCGCGTRRHDGASQQHDSILATSHTSLGPVRATRRMRYPDCHAAHQPDHRHHRIPDAAGRGAGGCDLAPCRVRPAARRDEAGTPPRTWSC